MKRSFIREILENIDNQTISFAGGLPDDSLFPNKDLQQCAKNVLKHQSSLQYGTSTGFEPLKEKIAKLYTKEGFPTSSKNIIITSGSQQALDIIARYHHHKSITTEAPSYLGAMNIFDLNNLKQDPLVLKKSGIHVKSFEKSFAQTKLAYLIPDFQNPSGKTYSQEKREKIAHTVKQHKGILIEDAPYSQLYFKQKNQSIASLIPHNSYHLGSFSKTLAPALRVGWIRANETLLQPLIAYKEAMDLHTNGLTQAILNDYLSQSRVYNQHLMILRTSYFKKMKLFSRYLDEILPQFEYSKPQGGMFIYGKLHGINTAKLVKKCLKKGVVFVPGDQFYTKNVSYNEIRFNFTHSSAEDIQKGLYIIQKALKEF
ncbi:MAG: PLP-dependent aminotransferase family protein [Campylobacterota bacterium]|nr:PLP-dependent aminotransferase family protein [Campylobacterota bacterium]